MKKTVLLNLKNSINKCSAKIIILAFLLIGTANAFSVGYAVSNTNPIISFIDPTPENASINVTESILVNTSIQDSITDNLTSLINWNNSLVGWWRMNENYGEVLVQDISGFSNNGTWNGNSTNNVTSGRFGNALLFDGVNDYVSISNADNLNISSAITIEAWINPIEAKNSGIVAKRLETGSENVNYNLYFSSDNKIGFYNGTLPTVNTINTIPLNVWSHIAVTITGTTLKFFINGALDSTQTMGLGATNAHPFLIGSDGFLSEYFNGAIDEVRIYDRALSQDEINASYDARTYRLQNNFTGLSFGNYSFQAFVQNSTGEVNQTENRTILVNSAYEFPQTFIPPSPINLILAQQGNFWINHTWQNGSGNVTDSYNISINGFWINSSSITYNNSTVGPHNWSNISVYAFNHSSTGTINNTPVTRNTQVENNVPVQTGISDKSVIAGSWLNFTVFALDADGDIITYGTNATNGSFDTTTGNFSWLTTNDDVNNYTWQFNSSDAYGGVVNEAITVVVSPVISDIFAPSITFQTPTPENGSEYFMNYVNVSVILNETGIAILNWNGINESMIGTGTRFHKNKTIRYSGNYNFKVYANDSSGNTNVSEIIIFTVNLTEPINLSSITENGTINQTINITSPSGNVTLTLFNGTNITLNGSTITNISIDSIDQINSTYALSGTDKFLGENFSLYPEGVHFTPDIQVRINYTLQQLNSSGISESGLNAKFYNTSVTPNSWETLTIYEHNTSEHFIIVNISHFSTFALIGTPITTKIPTSGGGGNGGSGGSGVVSSEPYANIAHWETYENNLISNTSVLYKFKKPELAIYEIILTGKEDTYNFALRVEALKGPTGIKGISSPPGTVYKNLNVWASSKNINKGTIRFKVENDWMMNEKISSDDILMVRWNGNEWIKLETSELNKDNTYTSYEARTDSLLNLAIATLKNNELPIITPSKEAEIAGKERKSSEIEVSTPTSTEKAPGFAIIYGAAVVLIIYLFKIKRY